MKFYNYPDPIVRTTIFQAILNLLHNSKPIYQPVTFISINESLENYNIISKTNLSIFLSEFERY